MHSIYTTKGFIIDSKPYGEAGKVIAIFTRDFGLVMATAQGIRLEKSKLRYHIQEYSSGTFSLIRGKEFWRLTNADSSRQVFENYEARQTESGSKASRNQKTRLEIPRIAFLLRRLLRGEQPHSELFDCVEGCIRFLDENSILANKKLNDIESTDKKLDIEQSDDKQMNDEQLKTLESITVLRIMNALGYVGKNPVFDKYLNSNELSIDLLNKIVDKRLIMNFHINKALKESHL